MNSQQLAKPSHKDVERLISLDAYRGFIMLALALNGFGLAATAKNHLAHNPDSKFWQFLQYQFSHVEWVGCAFWDLIQPSFMFMVGVSMAYSYVKRAARGDSWRAMFFHACTRAAILVFLGIFLISNGSQATDWSLMNVLTQIGLGYALLFLMWRRPMVVQALVCVALLMLTWLAYAIFPNVGIDTSAGAPELGVEPSWAQAHLVDVPPAWHKNANLGHVIDIRLLNWFPRKEPFEFNRGGYQTINFIPSLATMIFGLIIGELIRSARSTQFKLSVMFAAASAGVLLGLICHQLGCPIVKRIWTPSWTLFSSGICVAILAAFYLVIDIWGWRKWSIMLTVLGMNSIAVYVMGMLLKPWTERSWQTHFGQELFQVLGPDFEPTVKAIIVGGSFWLACYWMYRNKIFVRI